MYLELYGPNSEVSTMYFNPSRNINSLIILLFSFFSDLLVDMLGVLASYNLTVRELKLFFSKLHGDKGQWVKKPKYSLVFETILLPKHISGHLSN